MTEKERKRQHYLEHKQEYIDRSKRWKETHPEQWRKIIRNYAAAHRAEQNARQRASYTRRCARETAEEREVRLAHERELDTIRRRKAGIPERAPRMSDEERRRRKAQRWRERYHDPESCEERKRYERERKRAYRERKKLEIVNNNSQIANS